MPHVIARVNRETNASEFVSNVMKLKGSGGYLVYWTRDVEQAKRWEKIPLHALLIVKDSKTMGHDKEASCIKCE